MASDPMVEVLSVVSIELSDIGVRYRFCDVLHVDDLLQVALSDQGQQGSSDVVCSYNIAVQMLAQVIPIWPSVRRNFCMGIDSGYRHVRNSIRRHVHDAGVVDKDVEPFAIERLLRCLSGVLCTLRGCDLERDELNAAVGAFDQLLQAIRLLASSCKYFGDF